MKKLFYIQDTPANKISYYLLLFFLISLPFDRFYSELLLAGFCIHTLLHIKHAPFRTLREKETWLPATVFLLSGVGLVYTDFPGQGLNEWTRQSALLIFPVIMGISRLDLVKYRNSLLLAFSLTCSAVVLYLYVNAIHIICYNHLPFKSLLSGSFINHHFSAAINMHATYMSMYVFIGIIFLLNLFIQNRQRSVRLVCICCLIILGAGLVQLGSKSVLNSAFICIAGVFPFFIKNPGTRKVYSRISALASIIVAGFILAVPVLRNRYITGFKEDLIPYNYNHPHIDPRISRWLVAIDLIKDRPITGYGTGAEIPLLEEAYYERKMYFSYYNSLNAHNQYLGIALSTGCLGLLLFAGTLLAGIYIAVVRKDIIFTCFMALIMVVCFSENILLINKGIFFYGSLFSLFILAYGKKFTAVRNNVKETTKATRTVIDAY